MGKLFLVDDGTLDTVFECEECRETLRYSDVERDAYGDVPDTELERISEEHAEECAGPDVSHGALAERWHGGQWTPLYAYLSTRTVVDGLASELRRCKALAEDMDCHPSEVEALGAFALWAEANEPEATDE